MLQCAKYLWYEIWDRKRNKPIIYPTSLATEEALDIDLGELTS